MAEANRRIPRRNIGDRERRAITRGYMRGKSVAELAKDFGLARNSVGRIVHAGLQGNTHATWPCYRRIVYHGCKRWFMETGATFYEAAHVVGCQEKSISTWLRGEGQMPKRAIDALIAWTGMTYEELFYSPERLQAMREGEGE
jgi:plasmid maintenance system antidote protein VapI